jgi:hypothetical protein
LADFPFPIECICPALARERPAGQETWEKCESSSVAFAHHAIMESVGEQQWNLLQRNVEFHLSVSDVPEHDGEDVPLGNGRLAVIIECGRTGYDSRPIIQLRQPGTFVAAAGL